MQRAVVLTHVPAEGPERLNALFQEAGLAVEVVALHRGDPVPRSLPPATVLVVMGGPMGVSDIGSPGAPFLAGEVDLLREQLVAGRPVLGVCLGAQLLAHAAGARVYPNSRGGARVYEVGFGPVDFLAPDEPALAGVGRRETMLHWHGDTFDLPAGAVHLASTAACPHQAFRLGAAFGIQFHPEVERPTVDAWLAGDAAYVATACGPEGATRIRADADRLWAAYREAGDRLLRNVVRCLIAR